jgi:TP901 family phage tail tape measure protein
MASSGTVAIMLKMVDQSSRQMNNVSKAATNMSGKLNKAGNSMKSFGKKARATGANLTKSVTLPILALAGVGIKIYADFDKTMTNIEARTGASVEQMQKMRDRAIQLGRDTAFSPTQVGQAFLELAASGATVEESLIAVDHVLNLAAAGTIELGTAADLTTDILAQFGMEIEETERVANALVQAASSSSASVASLGEGFSKVGPIAKDFGMSVEETAATLAVFEENGIKGVNAGTQLKSMLSNMASQTNKTKDTWKRLGVSMFDVAGNMRDMDSIIDDLNVAMAGMSDEERIRTLDALGGSYGKMGLSALLANDGIDTMLGTMSKQNDAAAVAKKQMESFTGSVNKLKGSLEVFAITVLGPFVEDYLQPLVMGITDLLNDFTELAEDVPMVGTVVVGLGVALAALGPILWAIGAAAGVFGTIASGAGMVMGVIGPLMALFGTFFSAIVGGITTLLIPALSSAIPVFISFWTAMTGPIGLAVIAITGIIVALAALSPEAQEVLKAFGEILRKGMQNAVDIFKQILKIIGSVIERAVEAFINLGKAIIIGLAKGLWEGAKWAAKTVTDIGKGLVKGVKDIFGIKSPSKIMLGIGDNLGTSMLTGLSDSVTDGVAKMAKQVKVKTTSVLNPVQGANETGIMPGLSGGLVPSIAGAGAGDNGSVSIKIGEINMPPGTTDEHVNIILKKVTKKIKRRGGSGRSVIT